MQIYAEHTITVQFSFPIGFVCPDDATHEEIYAYVADSCKGFARQWLEQRSEEYDEMKPGLELTGLRSDVIEKKPNGEQVWFPGELGEEPWYHDETPQWVKQSIEAIAPTVMASGTEVWP